MTEHFVLQARGTVVKNLLNSYIISHNIYILYTFICKFKYNFVRPISPTLFRRKRGITTHVKKRDFSLQRYKSFKLVSYCFSLRKNYNVQY